MSPFLCIVIASDTVVVRDGRILGKPANPADAETMLRQLRGCEHAVYSGLAVCQPGSDRLLIDVARTGIQMRDYSDREMEEYIASGDPMDKAGAYAIQHRQFRPVANLDGCYANVVGLPLCHLVRCLRAWGIEPQEDVPQACQVHTGHLCDVYETILAGRACQPIKDEQ
jgi:MAF protein